MTTGCSGLPKLRQLTTAVAAGADAGQVGGALGHRQRRADARVDRAPARVGVGGDGHAPLGWRQARARQPEQRGVPAGPLDGVQEQLVVVLAVDPAGVGEQRQQVGAAVSGARSAVGPVGRGRPPGRPAGRAAARRGVPRSPGPAPGTSASTSPPGSVEHPQAAGPARRPAVAGRFGDDADDARPHLPALAQRLHRGPGPRGRRWPASAPGSRSSSPPTGPSPPRAAAPPRGRRPCRRRRAPPSRWSRTRGRPRPGPGCPTTSRSSSSSRHASISRFSSKGSPTCTLGRLASSAGLGPSRSKPADASTLTPPMPSRPVVEPEQDDEVARARGRGRARAARPAARPGTAR